MEQQEKEEMLKDLKKMIETGKTSSKEEFQIVIFKKGVPLELFDAKSYLLGVLMKDSDYDCGCYGSYRDLGFLHSYLNYEIGIMFASNDSGKEE